jgi:hypothetical protein
MHLHFLRMNPVHDYILGWYLLEQAPLALMASALSMLLWTIIHYHGQRIVKYKYRGWFTQGIFVLLLRKNLVHIGINVANLLFYAVVLILIAFLKDSRYVSPLMINNNFNVILMLKICPHIYSELFTPFENIHTIKGNDPTGNLSMP